MMILAITVVLVVAVFLYVRHKMIYFEHRLELLSDTIQTMAGVTCATLQASDNDSDESESTDSESADEMDESCSESVRFPTPERTTVSDDDVRRVIVPENEVEEIEVKKTEVELSERALETLTLKELKDRVTEINGPKLKTKKELIEFLQKI
jgi:hypothetical protein